MCARAELRTHLKIVFTCAAGQADPRSRVFHPHRIASSAVPYFIVLLCAGTIKCIRLDQRIRKSRRIERSSRRGASLVVRWDLLGASFVTSCSPPPSPPCRGARRSHGSARLSASASAPLIASALRRSTRHRLPSQRASASRQAAASIIYDVLEVSIVGHYTLDIHSVRTDLYCVIICTLCCTLRAVQYTVLCAHCTSRNLCVAFFDYEAYECISASNSSARECLIHRLVSSSSCPRGLPLLCDVVPKC